VIVDPVVACRKFERDVRPLIEDAALFTRIGLRPLVTTYPVLRVALLWPSKDVEIAVELTAPDWDYRPASVDWVTLEGEAWPLADAPSTNGFQGGAHPGTGRPWFCFPGALEYHEWESHSVDGWWPRRLDESARLVGFVQNVANVLRKM
jgi:hypothetical protein